MSLLYYRVIIILYRKGNDVAKDDDVIFWKRYMLAVSIVFVLLLLIWNNWSLTVLLLVQFHCFVWFYYQFEIFITLWTLHAFECIHGYCGQGLIQWVDQLAIATHHEWSLASVEYLVRVEKASTAFSNSFLQVLRKVVNSGVLITWQEIFLWN